MSQPNDYAAMAQQHWARFLPNRYQTIEDPDSFFSRLGREVAEEIDQLTHQMAGDDQPNEDYLGKLGRLNAARNQAREKVLSERILLPAEPGTAEDETEPATPPSDDDWIPVTEDPNHPFWQSQTQDEGSSS